MIATKEKMSIKDLNPGVEAVIVGTITKKAKTTKNNDPYFLVRINDTTAGCSAMVWHNLEVYPLVEQLADSDYVQADVVCMEIKDNYINVEIKAITKMEREQIARVDVEALKNELRNVIANMKDEHLRALVCAVLGRPDIKEFFFKAPATMMTGNSFEGGLVASVVRSIRLAKVVAQVFNTWEHNLDRFTSKLNEELLCAACILDAVGKVKAFRMGEKVEKTLEGELFEDSYLTLKIVNEELNKMDFPAEQRIVLEHVLGASKGRPDHGALHIPRSREAVAFHLISKLNFEMGQFEYLDRNASASEMFGMLFNKRMYLGYYDE